MRVCKKKVFAVNFVSDLHGSRFRGWEDVLPCVWGWAGVARKDRLPCVTQDEAGEIEIPPTDRTTAVV